MLMSIAYTRDSNTGYTGYESCQVRTAKREEVLSISENCPHYCGPSGSFFVLVF